MTRVLVLTHTDISSDSRILKEMEALAHGSLRCDVIGLGVEMEEGAARSSSPGGIRIQNLRLRTKVLRRLPRPLRAVFVMLVMLELTVRMLVFGIRTRAKIVHCHDTMVVPAGVLLKWFLGAKLVYDAHELESNKNGITPSFARATLLIETLAWRHVDLLISVSPSIVDWYHRKFGPRPSIVVLNSPVIAAEVGPTGGRQYFRAKFGIEAPATIFLYVGLLARGRGLEQLTQAFSRASDRAHLVLLGYGDLRDELLNAAENNPRIHVHDPVPHAELVALVRHADVGLCLIENVSLSDYYCLPNKLFEYAFAGIPVLASDFPELRRVVDRYRLGRCAALDPDSIEAAIAECVEHPLPPPAESVSELSWDEQARVLRNAYADLLTPSRS